VSRSRSIEGVITSFTGLDGAELILEPMNRLSYLIKKTKTKVARVKQWKVVEVILRDLQ
jgi:hypothetical protein